MGKYKIYFIFSALLLLANINVINAQEHLGVRINEDGAFDGYTLFSPHKSHNTFLINNCGEVVNEWTSEYITETACYLTDDGHMIRSCKSKTPSEVEMNGAAGLMEMRDWDNNIVWSYDFNTLKETTNHDFKQLPNGHLLMIFAESINSETTVQLGYQLNIPMIATTIKEIKMIGADSMEVVWQWKIQDHLIQSSNPLLDNFGVIKEHPERIDINYSLLDQRIGAQTFQSDFFHANSIDYHPELDQILVTLKHYSEIFIIDHSTSSEEAASSTGGKYGKGGDLLFRYGNPFTYGKGTRENRVLYHPHSGVWIDKGLPNEGNIMIFNNGTKRPMKNVGRFSDVLTIASPFQEQEQYEMNSTHDESSIKILYTYGGTHEEHFKSRVMSNVETLPNGNILIHISSDSRIIELNQNKEIVWEYIIPVVRDKEIGVFDELGKFGTFATHKYGLKCDALKGKDLSPKRLFGTMNPEDLPCALLSTDNTVVTKYSKELNNKKTVKTTVRLER